MNSIKHIRLKNLWGKVAVNLIIIGCWFGGILATYVLFECRHVGQYTNELLDSVNTISVLSIFMMLFSACIFYMLVNYSYERRIAAKKSRELEYISLGLDRLRERFVLIDVEKETYEFLYTPSGNRRVSKAGPYEEFISYLMQVVIRETDRRKLSYFLKFEHMMTYLTPDNLNYSFPVEIDVQGTLRWDLLSFIIVEQNEAGISKILLTRRDITETQAKEVHHHQLLAEALIQAESANKAKSSFLFNMSHDLRTPMNAIIGFTSMARKYLTDISKAEDYLNKVEMSSHHMLNIINDILDMARIDSGKVELESAPIDIYKASQVTDDLFRSSMEEKGIDFAMQVDVTDSVILADAMRLKQIVVNLLSNALKYTKQGGRILLHYHQISPEIEGMAEYEVSVKDTGIGMSEEYQHHLFEAFERERSETVSGIQGTGLGLAISKKLTDLMGGTLFCKSKLGEGTEFILRFKAPIATSLEQTSVSDIDVSKFKGKRILLVEDNDLNREIAVEMLEELGFLIDEATDGSEAVTIIANAKPGTYQLVLMDIQMPYMDGYHATRNIRMLPDKELASIPIVAMTANAFEEDKQKALKAGMNAHLPKPIDVKKTIEIIYQYI